MPSPFQSNAIQCGRHGGRAVSEGDKIYRQIRKRKMLRNVRWRQSTEMLPLMLGRSLLGYNQRYTSTWYRGCSVISVILCLNVIWRTWHDPKSIFPFTIVAKTLPFTNRAPKSKSVWWLLRFSSKIGSINRRFRRRKLDIRIQLFCTFHFPVLFFLQKSPPHCENAWILRLIKYAKPA